MGGSKTISNRAIERLQMTIRRRLADFLDLAPGGDAASQAEKRVELQIDELRLRLGKALAVRRRIERDQAGARAAGLQEKAEFAIKRGRDDLARAAVRRKLELERRNLEFEQELAALDEEAAGLEASLQSVSGGGANSLMSAKLRELEALVEEAVRNSQAKE